MPARQYHLDFDQVLRNERIIGATQGESIHKFLDKGSKKWAEAHRYKDPHHTIKGFLEHLSCIAHSRDIRKSVATDQIRVALGHLCLDKVVSDLKDRSKRNKGYAELPWNSIYRRVLARYIQRGFHQKVACCSKMTSKAEMEDGQSPVARPGGGGVGVQEIIDHLGVPEERPGSIF